MPQPLTAKRPTELSLAEQIVLIVLIGGPAAGLWYCWDYHKDIHADDPKLNLSLHIALFIFPLIWAFLMYHQPVYYEAAEGETLLTKLNSFHRMLLNWWMMFLMWATPVVAALVLAVDFFSRYMNHPELLSTSPGKATAILVVLTILAIFYAALFLGRSEPGTWISKTGLRTGILRFHLWQDLHHVTQQGRRFTFFHRVNPTLPLATLDVINDDARQLLERHLAENKIERSANVRNTSTMVKAAVVGGFLLNVAVSMWLRMQLGWSFIAVLSSSFGLGIVMTLVLERYRGISKFRKYVPKIEPQKMN